MLFMMRGAIRHHHHPLPADMSIMLRAVARPLITMLLLMPRC